MRFIAVGSAKPTSFFTHCHMRAARLLGNTLVGGVFSLRDPASSVKQGKDLGVTGYGTIAELIAGCTADWALVSTPNVAHFEPTAALIEAGMPVLVEKPLAFNLAEAKELLRLSRQRCVPVGVAYTYQNNWASTVGARLGSSGALGQVTTFTALYPQDWQLKDLGIDQEWRQDPAVSGDFNCAGDILTHVEQLVRLFTGQNVQKVIGVTQTVGPVDRKPGTPSNRKLDDDAMCLAQLDSGIWGVMKASQVASGHANGVNIEVNFAKGSILWFGENLEFMTVHLDGQGSRTYQRGRDYSQDSIVSPHLEGVELSPLPPGGHPGGFHDSLATMHHRFGLVVQEWQAGGKKTIPTDFRGMATLEDGVHGMRFLDAMKRSIESGNTPAALAN